MPNEERWEIFGNWFQLEREKTGVSQKVAAAKGPVHVVQLSRIETGKSGVKRETLIDLVEAINKISATGYRINVDEALPKAGFAPLNDSPDDNEGMFKGYEQLTPENKKKARIMVKTIIEQLAKEENPATDYIDDEEE